MPMICSSSKPACCSMTLSIAGAATRPRRRIIGRSTSRSPDAGANGACSLFVLPGALVVLILSMIYAAFGEVPLVAALFFGVKAAVLAIVIEALLRVARRALKHMSEWWIAAAAFAALYVFRIPFPLIILAAAITGFWRTSASAQAAPATTPIPWRDTLSNVALWLALW